MPLLILTIFLPHVASAQTLVNLPGGGSDFDSYINSLYVMAISIAALLAVLKIVIAGVKWMTTDVVSTKGDAKNDIRGALLGLVIIIGAVVILEVINPNILEVDVTLRQLETPERGADGDEQLAGSEQSAIERACPADDPDVQCLTQDCEVLGESAWDYVLAGTAMGAGAGTVVPVPGVGTVSGAVIGGAVGYGSYLAGNEVACQATCVWLQGNLTEINGSQVCVYDQESLATVCEQEAFCSVMACSGTGANQCDEEIEQCERAAGSAAEFGSTQPRVLCSNVFLGDLSNSLGFTVAPENIVGNTTTAVSELESALGFTGNNELGGQNSNELDLLVEYFEGEDAVIDILTDQYEYEVEVEALRSLREEVNCAGTGNQVAYLRTSDGVSFFCVNN